MSTPSGTPHRVLVGGTASGKKALATALFRRHGLRPLAMDSMKVYRGMDLGTDKPAPAVVAETGYGLIDTVGHHESYSTGRWAEDAAAEVRATDGPVLFTGGTPLYLRALLEGLYDGPPADLALRDELTRQWQERGEAWFRAQLAAVDPELEARLMAGDQKRLLRGLEVFRATGRPLSEWQRDETRPPVPGAFLVVGLRPQVDWHARRCQARARAMFSGGLLDEVRELLERGPFGPEPGRCIGYAEAQSVLAGELDEAAAVERVVIRTRQLVRKQRMFLARFEAIRWVDVGPETTEAGLLADLEQALELA